MFIPMISYGADINDSFKNKLDFLYEKNASLDDKINLFDKEFNAIFSYYNFLEETTKCQFEDPSFVDAVSPEMLENLKILATSIQEFYDNSDGDYLLILQQIKEFIVSHGQGMALIEVTRMLLIQFEKALDLASGLVQRYIMKREDYEFLAALLGKMAYEENLEADLDKNITLNDVPKDLLLRKVIKKALKDSMKN
jgi:hypothetical protein